VNKASRIVVGVLALVIIPAYSYPLEAIPSAIIESIRQGMVLMICPNGQAKSGFVANQSGKYYVFATAHMCDGIKIGQEVNCLVMAKPTDQQLGCKLVAFNNERDVAVYSIPEGSYSLSPVKISPAKILSGMEIGFAGYPFAIKGVFVVVPRKGMISSTYTFNLSVEDPQTKAKRTIDVKYFLIDGISNPGDSGGPVFITETGEVIGMLVGMTGAVDVSDKQTGIFLAVPVEYLSQLLKEP